MIDRIFTVLIKLLIIHTVACSWSSVNKVHYDLPGSCGRLRSRWPALCNIILRLPNGDSTTPKPTSAPTIKPTPTITKTVTKTTTQTVSCPKPKDPITINYETIVTDEQTPGRMPDANAIWPVDCNQEGEAGSVLVGIAADDGSRGNHNVDFIKCAQCSDLELGESRSEPIMLKKNREQTFECEENEVITAVWDNNKNHRNIKKVKCTRVDSNKYTVSNEKCSPVVLKGRYRFDINNFRDIRWPSQCPQSEHCYAVTGISWNGMGFEEMKCCRLIPAW